MDPVISRNARIPSLRSRLFIGGLMGALLVWGAATYLLRVPPPAGVSADEWAFCTDGNSAVRGPGIVDEIGRVYLGWEGTRGWDRDGVGPAELANQPGIAAACRIGFELFGLDQAEWDWCYDGSNRAAFLAPAVVMLGMGEDEAEGSDRFGEAPGDDPPEYAQACRLAYHHWRERGVPEIADPVSHPFLALTAAQQSWCDAAANRDVLEWTALQLGIVTPAEAPPAEQVTAYVRSCRIASIVGDQPEPDPPTVHVQDDRQVFSPEVRTRAEAELARIERSTGFVAVFVAEREHPEGLGDAPQGPEVEGYLELRFGTDPSDGCCAAVYEPRGLGTAVCCPFVENVRRLFSVGRPDDGLRAFVTVVEDLAGEPEPSPRRLPADPFDQSPNT